jgi:hypothetical protein
MVKWYVLLLLVPQCGETNEEDFVLESQHTASENEGPAPGVHVEEGAILDVTDK